MPETPAESVAQIQAGEQSLKDNQAGEGTQSLVFEPQSWEGTRCALNGLSAKLHGGDLFGHHGFGWYLPFYPRQVAIFAFLSPFQERVSRKKRLSGKVTRGEVAGHDKILCKPHGDSTYSQSSGLLMQLPGKGVEAGPGQ
jgi:hypothetical protein